MGKDCPNTPEHTTKQGISLCNRHYSRAQRYGGDWDAPIKTGYNRKSIEQIQDQFLRHTQKGTEGCLEWTGQIQPILENGRGGYGLAHVPADIEHRVRKTTAHRVSWLIFKGPLLENEILLHKCDNRICVNVEHLSVGTHYLNTQDMLDKGRHPRMGTIRKQYGPQILALRKEGMSQDNIAKELSISQSAVSKILRKEENT